MIPFLSGSLPWAGPLSAPTVVAWWRMLAEAQVVAGVRLMGLAGVVPLARGDGWRMLAEKPLAFAEAAMAGSSAVMAGKPADVIARAVMRPLGRRTRANLRRISRR